MPRRGADTIGADIILRGVPKTQRKGPITATPYRKLVERFRRLLVLGQTAGMLHWDMATMMPKGGATARAEQLAVLKAVQHRILADPETAELLETADDDDLDSWQRANLREMRRRWAHATALGEDLVQALARASAACEMAWREARPNADFAAVLPELEEVLALTREAAAAKAEAMGLAPYDALLDAYEPDGRSVDIDRVFGDLEAFLPRFLGKVLEAQERGPDIDRPQGPFPVHRQRALGLRLMAALGFDFDHGRLDKSLHPFCGGVPDDVRITTRYDEDHFTSSLMAVLHETGHALYERGLPREWRTQPVGQARSMSVHESQSLLVEMQVCRSRPFLTFAAPIMREALGGDGAAWKTDNLHRIMTRVAPGFIRVDADEVTYPAHVVLRYTLEKAMVAGELEARDLPGAWNEGMKRLLGLVPPSDREGCLQDLHWYDGAWGYFPTYTLGAITAAQLFDAARRADGDIEPAIARGDFAPLFAWLGENVHGKGSLLTTGELLFEATGRALDVETFEAHLEGRYLP